MKETFTRKIGPLPMYAWLLIVGGVIVGWAWWRNRQQPSSASGSSAGASQVPQFVNQTYTTVQPPSAHPVHDKDDDEDHDKDDKKYRPPSKQRPDRPASGSAASSTLTNAVDKAAKGAKKNPVRHKGKAVHPAGHPALRRVTRG